MALAVAREALADASLGLLREATLAWEAGAEAAPRQAVALVAAGALGLALVHAALLVAHKVLTNVRHRWVLRTMPMAPGWLPVLGHTVTLFASVGRFPCTWDLFSEWARATAPKPVRVQIFDRECVLIACPEMVKRVFQTNIKAYAKDLNFAYAPFMDILGSGLVTAEGELWKKQRLLVSAAFRIEILDEIVGISVRAAERLAAKLETYRGTGRAVNMSEEFRHLTLQVIAEGILSMTAEEADSVFPHLYLPVMEEFNRRSLAPWRTYLPLPEWVRTRLRVRQLNQYVLKFVRNRWKERMAGEREGREDIIDRVMSAIKPSEWGPAMEKQLCYEIKTFVLAGHETSASMLTWTLYEMTQSPEKLDRLLTEGKPVFGGLPKHALPGRDALETLTYTVGALKESLRKYSIVPVVTRECIKDDELGGCRVPAGCTVIIVMQGVHHRADIWPEPMEFKPERFLPKEEGGSNFGTFDFLPFIQGPRNCLGQHLALLESRIVLQLLVHRFRFTSVHLDNGVRHPGMVPIAPWRGSMMTVD